jgi:hypothetical protein
MISAMIGGDPHWCGREVCGPEPAAPVTLVQATPPPAPTLCPPVDVPWMGVAFATGGGFVLGLTLGILSGRMPRARRR